MKFTFADTQGWAALSNKKDQFHLGTRVKKYAGNKMKDVLQYNGFIGSVHFNAEDTVFHGKIEGISDLVTFEGESVAELQQAFKDAIEDYIDICEQNGKPVHKSYKGNLNVKISAELHRKAMQKSLMSGISLNQFVENAIEHEIANNY